MATDIRFESNDNANDDQQQPLLGFSNPGVENDAEERLSSVSSLSARSSVKKESSTTYGTVTFLKCLIGTGILALPYVINAVGVLPAWILLLTIGYLNLYVMQLIHKVATQLGLVKVDVGQLALKVTNSQGFRYFSEINLLIVQIGTVTAAVIFILEYLEEISCYLGWSAICGHKAVQFGLILVFLLPAATITDLHYLAVPNMVALCFQCTLFVVFIFTSIQIMSTEGISNGGFRASINRFNVSSLPVAFATMLYAYEGVGVLLEVRTSVAESKKFDTVLYSAFIVSTIAYTFFGSVGALAYGDASQSIIFLSMDNTNKFLLIVEFGYIMALILGMPSNLFPVSRLIENYSFFKKFIMDKATGQKSKIKRQMVRLPMALFICAIAAVVPSFGSFLSLLGGCNFVILCFVFPVIIYYYHFREDPNRRGEFIVNWIIMAVGIILGIIAVVQSVISMVQAEETTSTST